MQFLEQDIPSLEGLPVDYKIWCFDGEPYSIWVNYNRTRESTFINVYDLDWNLRPEASIFNERFTIDGQMSGNHPIKHNFRRPIRLNDKAK